MIETITLAVQVVMTAGLGVLAKWIANTKTQVTNDHKTNLRDDLDDIRATMHEHHAKSIREIGMVNERVARVESKVYTTNILIAEKGK